MQVDNAKLSILREHVSRLLALHNDFWDEGLYGAAEHMEDVIQNIKDEIWYIEQGAPPVFVEYKEWKS